VRFPWIYESVASERFRRSPIWQSVRAAPLVRPLALRLLSSSRPKYETRRYSWSGSLSELDARLTQNNVVYLTLRGRYPDVNEDLDIDLLVADDSIGKLEGLLAEEESHANIQIDVYPHSLPWDEIDPLSPSYLPTPLAEEMLNDRIYDEKYGPIPTPVHYLDSLTYHLVYHKGFSAAVTADRSAPRQLLAHKYASRIAFVSESIGIPPLRSLGECIEYLEGRSLLASGAVLDYWRARNRWLRGVTK